MAQRPQEMARYTRELREPWRRRVEEQAKELEHALTEREASRARIAELEAPPPPAPRRWWRRLS